MLLFVISLLIIPSFSSSLKHGKIILAVNTNESPRDNQHANKLRTLMCTSEACATADDASTTNDDDDNDNSNNEEESASACQQYITPLDTCYNAQFLFPNDESWSDMDIYDTITMMNLKRTFYPSKDGTCVTIPGKEGDDALKQQQQSESDDSFILPLDVCVGPFGSPRPWGKFTLVFDIRSRDSEDADYDIHSSVN